MIQDIFPHVFHNEFHERESLPGDFVAVFSGGKTYLSQGGALPTAAQAASGIARQSRSGGCIAYLGADTAVQEDWSALLSRLRSSSRLITALNELAVTKDA